MKWTNAINQWRVDCAICAVVAKIQGFCGVSKLFFSKSFSSKSKTRDSPNNPLVLRHLGFPKSHLLLLPIEYVPKVSLLLTPHALSNKTKMKK